MALGFFYSTSKPLTGCTPKAPQSPGPRLRSISALLADFRRFPEFQHCEVSRKHNLWQYLTHIRGPQD